MAQVVSNNAQDLESAKEACRKSLYYLCTSILGYKDWDIIHDDIERFIKMPARRKLLLVPRGHLKTAIVTKALSIQQILRNPNARVLIANQVWDKAREMLYEIKEFLTNKSILPHLFGTFESTRWNAEDIVIKQRTKALSAPTIGTTGVEAEMTSTHYDVILADDLQGLQNCQTKDQRDKVKRFYRSLLDLLEPGGLLICVGTRWHEDDLYAEILDKERDYYDVMIRKVVEEGKLIFPKKFSLRMDGIKKEWVFDTNNCMDYVQYLKKSKGAEYFAQYENNPIAEDTQLFKRAMFKYFSKRPDNLYTALTCDLAISQKQEADYTVLMITGMDTDWNIYVLDYLRGKWSPGEVVKNIFDMEAKWKPNAIGLESNVFQKTLKYACEEEMRKRHHHFPIGEIQTGNQQSKEYRIKAFEPYYRDGKVFHAQWMNSRHLEDELIAFPKGRHDDLIDALSMALNILIPGQGATQQQLDPRSWESYAKQAREHMNPWSYFSGY